MLAQRLFCRDRTRQHSAGTACSRSNIPLHRCAASSSGAGAWLAASQAASHMLQQWEFADYATRAVMIPIALELLGTPASTTAVLERYKRSVLLECPDEVPCIVLSTATSAVAMLLLQLPRLPNAAAAPGSSSNSSSGGSPYSRVLPCVQTAAAWDLAGREHTQLPATVQQLLGLIGCSSGSSSRVLVAAAAGMAARFWVGTSAPSAAEQFSIFVEGLLLGYIFVLGREPEYRYASRQQHGVHVLLPALLLYRAAHQPADAPGDGMPARGAAMCTHAVHVACAAMSEGSDRPKALFKSAYKDVMPLAVGSGRAVLDSLGCSSSSSGGGGRVGHALAAVSAVSSNPEMTAFELLRIICTVATGARFVKQQQLRPLQGQQDMAWGEEYVDTLGQLFEVAVRCWDRMQCSQMKLLASVHALVSTDGSVFAAVRRVGVTAATAAVPGGLDSLSPEIVQYLSMYLSLLKRMEALPFVAVEGPVAEGCCGDIATAVRALPPGQVREVDGGARFGGKYVWRVSERKALCGVPWFAVLGRAMLYTARRAGEVSNAGFITGGNRALIEARAQTLNVLSFLKGQIVRELDAWLSAPGVCGVWQYVGLDMPPLLFKADACCRSITSGPPLEMRLAALQALGIALNTLPFPYACNNPSCRNLAGAQEVQLVKGSTSRCSACRVARYCSKECQRQHWKAHKPVCAAVAAAGAAAAGAE